MIAIYIPSVLWMSYLKVVSCFLAGEDCIGWILSVTKSKLHRLFQRKELKLSSRALDLHSECPMFRLWVRQRTLDNTGLDGPGIWLHRRQCPMFLKEEKPIPILLLLPTCWCSHTVKECAVSSHSPVDFLTPEPAHSWCRTQRSGESDKRIWCMPSPLDPPPPAAFPTCYSPSQARFTLSLPPPQPHLLCQLWTGLTMNGEHCCLLWKCSNNVWYFPPSQSTA